jgi:cellulose synthase/poly-beta-1,6-N-acetylglucosamine synthase-like glycosyltransferase
MQIISTLFVCLFWAFAALPCFLSVVAQALPRKSKKVCNSTVADFACVFTAYKDLDGAQNAVDSLLLQHYPTFHIYLVADDCELKSFDTKHERLTVLVPPFPLHSKLKSIQLAISHFKRNHSHLVVFDPDNLAQPTFLEEIEAFHAQDYAVVQGKRVAKNLDSPMACLDAFSEYYYNYTQRFVPFRLGSSATIAGSGMSVEMGLFNRFLKEEIKKKIETLIIAEDKLLQVFVVQHGHRIAFAQKAIVYDEKVTNGPQVKRQRTRWIASYFQHLATAFQLLLQGIAKRSLNQTLFAYTIIIPPLFLLGLFGVLGSVVLAFLSKPAFIFLQIGFLVFLANIFWAMAFGKVPKKVIVSLFYAPLFVWNQLKAFFSMKDTKTSFLTTTKTKNVSLKEVLNAKL